MTSCRHNCFHAPEDVEVGIGMSLKNLGLDYGKSSLIHQRGRANDEAVDLYLMHCQFKQPFFFNY